MPLEVPCSFIPLSAAFSYSSNEVHIILLFPNSHKTKYAFPYFLNVSCVLTVHHQWSPLQLLHSQRTDVLVVGWQSMREQGFCNVCCWLHLRYIDHADKYLYRIDNRNKLYIQWESRFSLNKKKLEKAEKYLITSAFFRLDLSIWIKQSAYSLTLDTQVVSLFPVEPLLVLRHMLVKRLCWNIKPTAFLPPSCFIKLMYQLILDV